MIFIILFIITLVLSVWTTKVMWTEEMFTRSVPGNVLISAVVLPLTFGAYGFIIGFVIGLPVAALAPTHDVPAGTVELHAINMGDQINGRFYLGSGRIDESSVYTYYEKTEGGFRSGRIDADDSLVIEDSGETPRIEVFEERFPWWVSPVGYWDKHYVVYVPEGSVKPMIDMDLPE